MLHVWVQRFDVTKNLKKFCKILGTKQALKWHELHFFCLSMGISSYCGKTADVKDDN